jgi:hypothetical protein
MATDERFLQQLWQVLRIDAKAPGSNHSSLSPQGRVSQGASSRLETGPYPLPRAAYGAVPQLAKNSSTPDTSKGTIGSSSADPLEQERLAFIKSEILRRAASIGGADSDAYTLYHSMKTAQETIKIKNQTIRDLNAKINDLQSQVDSLRQRIERENSHNIIGLESLLPAPVLASLSPNASKSDLMLALKNYIDDLKRKSVTCFDEEGSRVNDGYTFHHDEGDVRNVAAPLQRTSGGGGPVDIFALGSPIMPSGAAFRNPNAASSLRSADTSLRSIDAANVSSRKADVETASISMLKAVIAERDAVIAENAVLKAKISGLYKQKRLSNIALHEYTDVR